MQYNTIYIQHYLLARPLHTGGAPAHPRAFDLLSLEIDPDANGAVSKNSATSPRIGACAAILGTSPRNGASTAILGTSPRNGAGAAILGGAILGGAPLRSRLLAFGRKLPPDGLSRGEQVVL